MDPCADELLITEDPDDRAIHQLVLDYLIHNCYGETAKIIFKDSQYLGVTSKEDHYTNGFNQTDSIPNGNTSFDSMYAGKFDADGDLEMKDSNLEKLVHVNNSNNSLSQESNNSKILTLLDSKKIEKNGFDVEFALKSLDIRKQIREYIKVGNISAALSLCQTSFPEIISANGDDLKSIEICFKLHTQQFIEIVRSGNAIEALMFAQTVLDKFTEPHFPNEQKFREELNEVSSIMAYTDPETSPSARFFSQARRDQLADEINNAILSRGHQMSESVLEKIIKQATVAREYLHHAIPKGQRSNKVISTIIALVISVRSSLHFEAFAMHNWVIFLEAINSRMLIVLEPINKSFTTKKLQLVEGMPIFIGRATSKNTIPKENNGYFSSKVLSRRHAEIWYLKSINGTFVNDNCISAGNREGDSVEIFDGDTLEFGLDIINTADVRKQMLNKVVAKVNIISSPEFVLKNISSETKNRHPENFFYSKLELRCAYEENQILSNITENLNDLSQSIEDKTNHHLFERLEETQSKFNIHMKNCKKEKSTLVLNFNRRMEHVLAIVNEYKNKCQLYEKKVLNQQSIARSSRDDNESSQRKFNS
ncbi:42_t:CDS:10 [Diversispora eburnea]|uniref:42_t:CDS:1 n=1 Tax=Diversispora eburnea TaxID=1213867 RepID=A0A9N8Z7V6_9GLOM|nr:42_t:CDS:10 [Diversispora eburnea]